MSKVKMIFEVSLNILIVIYFGIWQYFAFQWLIIEKFELVKQD